MYNIPLIKDHLYREGKIKKQEVKELILKCTDILRRRIVKARRRAQPAAAQGQHFGDWRHPRVSKGDCRQYYDFVKMLDLLPDLSQSKYLFLGDYVDRGEFSMECLILIFCLKISYPSQIFLMRGNHESRQMTGFFNFRTECTILLTIGLEKYDQEIYELVMIAFDALPLAAVINGRFLCVHGGLSPEMNDKTDIDTISRFQEPPMCGMFCDLLWSDPATEEHGRPKNSMEPFVHNDVRGCSYFFGYEACNRFLRRNNYLTLIRAHEAKLDGYQCHNWNNEPFPQVITIFSAPNYCGVYQNVAGFINFEVDWHDREQRHEHPAVLSLQKRCALHSPE